MTNNSLRMEIMNLVLYSINSFNYLLLHRISFQLFKMSNLDYPAS